MSLRPSLYFLFLKQLCSGKQPEGLANSHPRRERRYAVSRLEFALVCAIAPALVSLAAAAQEREALWSVVQACRINRELTGAAFPCLEVNLSGGVYSGYAILRPPLGDEDLILSPTRKVIGIEDSSLQAAGAPAYFDMAWRSRSILAQGGRAPIARDDFALAVNSRRTRTQDQLHIHIGCVSKKTRQSIAAVATELSAGRWRRSVRPIKGMLVWARALDELASVNIFRLVAESPANMGGDMGALTIVIAGAPSAMGRDGFVVLVGVDDTQAGSDLLERSCS
jgi:CDP-diacylglycerol pyrophosphatase